MKSFCNSIIFHGFYAPHNVHLSNRHRSEFLKSLGDQLKGEHCGICSDFYNTKKRTFLKVQFISESSLSRIPNSF